MEYPQALHMLAQALKYHGKNGVITRYGQNAFGEPGEEREICRCRGLYHASSGFLDITLAESGQISTRKKPMCLVLYNAEVKKNDRLQLGGKKYRVTGIGDPGEWHLCLDLSLEEEDTCST